MKCHRLFPLVLTGLLLISAVPALSQHSNKEAAMLIFSKTEGFRHASIPEGIQAFKELARQKGIAAVHSENAHYFHPDSLSKFNLVVFLNTTGNILDNRQQQHLEEFIANGGGFIGLHSAADTEYDWPWYGKLVGAYFESHPPVQEASLSVVNNNHSTTAFLPDQWVRTDEWYNYKDINPDIKVLLNLEEATYEGGKNGASHPISWYQDFKSGGRMFYTGGGHTKESYEEPLFRQHLAGGIDYVLGDT